MKLLSILQFPSSSQLDAKVFRTMFALRASIALMAIGLLISTAQLGITSEPLTEHIRKLGNGKASPATVEEMKWLAGTWRGTGMGGEVEEIWSEPKHGSMMGMFRFVKDGKLEMMELMTLSEKDGAMSLKVKHFSPDLVAWEEKEKYVEFPWIEKDDKGCYFEGITFAPNKDELAIYVAMKGREGKIDEIRFDFKKVER